MTITQLRAALDLLSHDIDNLSFSEHRQILLQLLNIVESCSTEIEHLTNSTLVN